jgi:hypothetical protein
MNNQNQSFDFRQCILLLKSTGRKARDLKELREAMATVSDQSIYHHTYEYFLKDISVEYTNDFAHWAGEFLEERSLAERLSMVDPFSHNTIQEVRNELLLIIDTYLNQSPQPRAVWPGDEFYFNEAVSVIFPAGVRIRNLAEFLMAIKYLEPASIYYHFYEARVRLGSRQDDFSQWMDDVLGETALAEKIRAIDPFMNSLGDIKEHLIQEVEQELRADMETVPL